jgi:hypothetical protein
MSAHEGSAAENKTMPEQVSETASGGVTGKVGAVLVVGGGISGMQSIRWNCPPELALLTLTANREPSAT